MEAKLAESDKLLREKKYQACEELLKSIKNVPEVAWRKARLIYVQTTTLAEKPSKDVLQKTFQRALDEVDAGLKANANHANCLTIQTQLLIAKCYERLKNKGKAKEYCQKVQAMTETGYLAEEAKREAKHISEKL
ncbi:hypothetical protein X801_00349 [Opisthorchis viverrini]|uniref:Tetratricopeptide repeat protein n=1 Tax=Opisthorchis viverrini TaxID=6198 RepID=A0A1S8XAM0_OPIVI|nr:hypothetical protein X801_00349 [Opisthorchis viverrini]